MFLQGGDGLNTEYHNVKISVCANTTVDSINPASLGLEFIGMCLRSMKIVGLLLYGWYITTDNIDTNST